MCNHYTNSNFIFTFTPARVGHYRKFPTGFNVRVRASLYEGWGAGVFCAVL